MLDRALFGPHTLGDDLLARGLRVLRYPYAIVRDLAGGELTLRATGLVYATLLALIPLVALSFAVVQKSLATDSVKVEQRRLEAENADLAAQVTQLRSGSRIRQIAEHQLGLVPAERPIYLTVPKKDAATASAERH